MCRTPDPIGGNAVRFRIRRLAMVPSRTDAIYLALPADLSPDSNRGSAISSGSANVNLRRLIFSVYNFKDFITSNPDFGPVVVFLDCPFHRVHRLCSKMRWPDDCGSVREGPERSTGLGSGHSAAFSMRQKHKKNESYAERQHIYVHVVLIGFYTDSLPNFSICCTSHDRCWSTVRSAARLVY